MACPNIFCTVVLIVPVYVVLAVSGAVGLNVAVFPIMETVPATVVVPCTVKEEESKVEALIY
jgi:hypothetical protein